MSEAVDELAGVIRDAIGTNGSTAPDRSDDPTSWQLVDLAAVADSDPPTPTILHRSDGVCLLYPGRVNAIHAEPEAGKTWLALIAAAEVIAAGHPVLFVDLEDSPQGALARLTALGIDTATTAQHLGYVQPTDAVADNWGRHTRAADDFHQLIASRPWALVVIDAVGESMATEGLGPLDNADVATWYRRIVRPIAASGAAVLLLDHVTKNREGRGRWAIGAQAKLAAVTGAAYTLTVTRPIARAHTEPVEGLATLTIAKDRPGAVRAHAVGSTHTIADLRITAWPDHGITHHLEPPGGDTISRELAQRIADHLRAYPADTKTNLRTLGNSDAIDAVLLELVGAGHITVERKGQSHRHTLTALGDETYPPTTED